MFTINGNGVTIKFEIGHTKDELIQSEDCWDFKIEELLNGAIEPDPDMVYWLIGGRLYEHI